MKRFNRDIDFHRSIFETKRRELVQAVSIVYELKRNIRLWEQRIEDAKSSIILYTGKGEALKNEIAFHEQEFTELERLRRQEIRGNRTKKRKQNRKDKISELQQQMKDMQDIIDSMS